MKLSFSYSCNWKLTFIENIELLKSQSCLNAFHRNNFQFIKKSYLYIFQFSKHKVAWKPTETVRADLNSVPTYLNECQ